MTPEGDTVSYSFCLQAREPVAKNVRVPVKGSPSFFASPFKWTLAQFTSPQEKETNSLLLVLIKREILTSRELLYTKFGDQFLLCKKDAIKCGCFSLKMSAK